MWIWDTKMGFRPARCSQDGGDEVARLVGTIAIQFFQTFTCKKTLSSHNMFRGLVSVTPAAEQIPTYLKQAFHSWQNIYYCTHRYRWYVSAYTFKAIFRSVTEQHTDSSITYRTTVLRPKDCCKWILENMYIAIWAQYSYRSCGVLHSFYIVPSIVLYVPLSKWSVISLQH